MTTRTVSPLRWVPSAYLAEGIPFALVVVTSGALFKDLGYGDAKITLATASVTIMWSLKPLYAGFLDMFRTKKFWVLLCELTMAALLGLCAAALWLPDPFWPIVALLWLLAAASATQDICIDGIYITTLDARAQSTWIGWQGAFWSAGRVFAAAVVVGAAGVLQTYAALSAPRAWASALLLAACAMVGLFVYHVYALPEGALASRRETSKEALTTFVAQFTDFLRKPSIGGMLLFVLLYRSSEGFLLMETPLFMQSGVEQGGLGMCATRTLTETCPHLLSDRATIDGLISTTVSVIFGILGGAFAARVGLNNRLLLIMAFCINVPNLTLVYLSQMATPDAPLSLATIASLVTLEKAGYSFGFVANMLYMMQQVSPGKYPMTHFAFATALMNLILVPTQALSGPLAEALGYRSFFVFVCVASIPSFLAAAYAPFPRKSEPVPLTSC